jgi:hypothetical protein
MNRRLLLECMFACTLATLVSCKKDTPISRSSLPFGSVDLPTPRSTVRGLIQVAGWALADQSIREVSVYVDRKYLTAASLNVARPDVAVAEPGYRDARNCGYRLTVDSSTLSPGWHEIVVQARAEDGATRDLATVPVLVQR